MPRKHGCRIALLTFALALGLACARTPPPNFNEGPPRVHCRPEGMLAIVGKPWRWSCVISGQIAQYADAPIAFEIITKGREAYPARSVIGLGLPRVYNGSTIFDIQYYLDLTGNSKIGPNERDIEVYDPNDITNPHLPMLPPIEGVEASLDGSFWMRITFYEVTYFDPATKQISVKPLAGGRVNGRLTCPQCAV